MNKTNSFFLKHASIIGVLFFLSLLLIIERDPYYIFFTIFYIWVYVWTLYYTGKYLLPLVSFALGLIIDSVYDLSIGTFSFILLASIILINLQSSLIKNNDFIKSITFFSINTIGILVFIKIINFIIPINFPSIFLFLLISYIIFPVIFTLVKVYLNLFNIPYE